MTTDSLYGASLIGYTGSLLPDRLICVVQQPRAASAEQIAAQARACLAVGDIEGASRLLSKLENQ